MNFFVSERRHWWLQSLWLWLQKEQPLWISVPVSLGMVLVSLWKHQKAVVQNISKCSHLSMFSKPTFEINKTSDKIRQIFLKPPHIYVILHLEGQLRKYIFHCETSPIFSVWLSIIGAVLFAGIVSWAIRCLTQCFLLGKSAGGASYRPEMSLYQNIWHVYAIFLEQGKSSIIGI